MTRPCGCGAHPATAHRANTPAMTPERLFLDRPAQPARPGCIAALALALLLAGCQDPTTPSPPPRVPQPKVGAEPTPTPTPPGSAGRWTEA